MARCPLCESDVPDGRTDCDACGQPFDQPPTVQAGAGEVKTSVAAAKKDIGRAGQDPADVAFPQRLLDRAEQEVAAGHLGPALDLARAARRATGIIRREARVADALARADAVIAEATTAGIDTETFRRNVEQARALASRGDHASAERLLKRVSLRGLDERREDALHTSLEKAEARIRYAKERGGTVGDAEASSKRPARPSRSGSTERFGRSPRRRWRPQTRRRDGPGWRGSSTAPRPRWTSLGTKGSTSGRPASSSPRPATRSAAASSETSPSSPSRRGTACARREGSRPQRRPF